ncbi:hypothetical protein FSP39_020156 [Pinctada imbricata]|uniref:RRM domain-containing protein n=1 Tax=Pinctada imbricata TaxID=66713 RepID=A0AA89C234_PINIB|nr:hypothetical protein FSP39_020156 [Pinctada imbricata]
MGGRERFGGGRRERDRGENNTNNFGRGRGISVQRSARGAIRGKRGAIRGRIGLNRAPLAKKPLSVTVPGNNRNFDARDKIAGNKRPADARDKLAQRAQQTDARVKILNIKAKKGNGNDNPIQDVRGKLTAKRQGSGVQVTFDGSGNTQNNNTRNNVTRTINNNAGQNTATDFQITRTIGGSTKFGGNVSGLSNAVQVSGNNLTITRNVGASNPVQQNSHLTKVISNIPVHTSTPPVPMAAPHYPVIQYTAESHSPYQQPVSYQYSQPPPPIPTHHVPQPTYYMGTENTYYDDLEEEEEDELELEDPDPVGIKPSTYLVEKTLTVKRPQLLSTKSNVISLKSTGSKTTKIQQQALSMTSVATKRKAPVVQNTGPLKFAKSSVSSDSGGGGGKRLKVIKQEEDMETDSEAKVVANSPLGFRVIISNLHTVVSQDDIIELFGAVGPMKRARLVKAGVAEVVYTQKGDAQKAIQKYHNRELDGLPMTVKMYTPPAPSPKKTPENILGNVKDVEGPLRLGKDAPKKSSDLDMSVLHKVLFKAGTPSGSKPVTFTVKV